MINLSYEDIRKDYDNLNCICTKSERVELMKRYNAEYPKLASIKNAILNELKNRRDQKIEFTSSDITDFERLDGKIQDKLMNESVKFIEFYIFSIESKLKSKNIDPNVKLGRDWNYYISYAQKYLIDTYKIAVKILNEKTGALNKQEDIIKKIYNVLIENTVDFHNKFIDTIKIQATNSFDRLLNKGKVKENEKEDFINAKIRLAEEEFKNSLYNISVRLFEHGVDDKLSIEYIGNDMKYFELIIKSNNKILHCRAIIAAEYSEKVETHLRYIITEKR